MQDFLEKARKYEQEHLSHVSAAELPRFHVTGGIGWINDPNGFSVYQGEYHLFFQYYPYETKWGPMHWGHVKTGDFIRWERLPAALAPDRDYDRDGCFSGSAVELEDGRHLLMYTGVCKKIYADGQTIILQTQCAAIGDGINYEKYEGNPVIEENQLPQGGDPENFRDPGIWKDERGYHAVIGNRRADDSGTVVLYDSEDALHWKYRGILAASCGGHGDMWECPNYFHLSGKDVLLASVQNMNAAVCLIGTYDPEKHCLDRERMDVIDQGTDFYAPQTLETPDGRRIMIAWMQNWKTSAYVPEGLRFFGQMTVPRELTIRGGRLLQLPIRELENYRGNKTRYHNVLLTGQISLSGIDGRCLDMTVRIRPVDDGDPYKWFCMKVAMSDQYSTSIRYEPGNSTLCVDRAHSGYPCDIDNIREFPVRDRKGMLDLRIVMDRYSLEVFVNEGEQAASFVIYTPESSSSVSFACEGSLLLDVEKYDLVL